jgi:hypothetical protein
MAASLRRFVSPFTLHNLRGRFRGDSQYNVFCFPDARSLPPAEFSMETYWRSKLAPERDPWDARLRMSTLID